jgi:RNA polymerase subunit RPABC4/transcription elongation factor Spt4
MSVSRTRRPGFNPLTDAADVVEHQDTQKDTQRDTTTQEHTDDQQRAAASRAWIQASDESLASPTPEHRSRDAVLSCANCGRKMTERSKFCPDCGTKIADVVPSCASCGRKMTVQSRFCPDCGVASPGDSASSARGASEAPVDTDALIGVKLSSSAGQRIPKQVQSAVTLIFISLAIALLTTVYMWDVAIPGIALSPDMQSLRRWSTILGSGILFGLAVMIQRRANWARIIFAVVYGLGILLALVEFSELRKAGFEFTTLPSLLFISGFVQFGLQGWAVYSLYEPTSKSMVRDGRVSCTWRSAGRMDCWRSNLSFTWLAFV